MPSAPNPTRRPRTRLLLAIGVAALGALASPVMAWAAPSASYVMDARTGETLYASRSEDRLHPASLTKMMTIYLAIEAVKDGRLKLDQKIRVSSAAAAKPPSRIGLRTGQMVTVRDLMRATVTKSANDAATALAEATSGSVEAWGRDATAKAKMLGKRPVAALISSAASTSWRV